MKKKAMLKNKSSKNFLKCDYDKNGADKTAPFVFRLICASYRRKTENSRPTKKLSDSKNIVLQCFSF